MQNSQVDKTLKVFVGSTFSDLGEFRQEALNAIVGCRYLPIMMEHFPSMDKTAVEGCLEEVRSSDIYIGIFAHRYGYCPNGSMKSITELEFEEARKHNKPVFCFVVDDSVEWDESKREDEPGKSLLIAFKNKIREERIVSYFRNKEHLHQLIQHSLYQFRESRVQFQIGDYTATQLIATQIDDTEYTKVSIYIEGTSYESFDKASLVGSIAGILNIPRKLVKVSMVYSGSVIVEILLRDADADRLIMISKQEDKLKDKSNTIVELTLPDEYAKKLTNVAESQSLNTSQMESRRLPKNKSKRSKKDDKPKQVNLNIDEHETRQKLAKDTPIVSASPVPTGVIDDTHATITIGNYIGWESREDGMPDLVPTIHSLVYYANLIANEKHDNRLLALARQGALDRSPHYIRETIKSAIVQVDKKDGEYTLSKRQALGVGRAIKAKKVIWGSPAQTTDNNGLTTRVKTGLIRFARKFEANVSILGIELDPDTLDQKIPIRLHLSDIELPTIVYDPPLSKKNNNEIQLNKHANEAMTLYLLAYIATLLPENQRGEYIHVSPQAMMQKQTWQLGGMQVDGLYISGGFLDDAHSLTNNSQSVKPTSFFQRLQNLVFERD